MQVIILNQLEKLLRELKVEKNFQEMAIYLDLLLKWNESVNLISKNDIDIIVERHFRDSLLALNFVCEPKYKNIVDIGSGNGFPAIPLAIVFKEKNFTLIEIKEKKCYFLKEVKESLGLKNVMIKNDDVNSINFSDFDLVLSRAFLKEEELKTFMKDKNFKGDIVYWKKINKPVLIKL
ncbi:MAG: 16S rRNA (guanine(527)-N(7))-methyltransferase RsmG [candidate division WOR-3 bacterium]